MSRHVLEIETVLAALLDEHRKLLAALDGSTPPCALDSDGIEQASRCAGKDPTANRHVGAPASLAGGAGRQGDAVERGTQRFAPGGAFPARSAPLSKLRDELRDLVGQIRSRSNTASRLVTAMLGHLNGAVRLIAGAMEQAGVYNKSGAP